MATEVNSVWAIDLGNNSLKAMRLSNASGVLEVLDFDVIEHGKILSGRGVEELERQPDKGEPASQVAAQLAGLSGWSRREIYQRLINKKGRMST